MKKRFTEEQIIAVLKEAEAGIKVGGPQSEARHLRAQRVNPFETPC
jgi:hypothetical protein